MQDRFKFRYWSKRHNCFVDANLWECNNGDSFPVWSKENLLSMHKKGSVIIEQCTGLKDKKGRLLYEGDIIRVEDNNCLIAWDNDNARYNVGGYGEIAYLNYNEIEVIGNIHENPELMED